MSFASSLHPDTKGELLRPLLSPRRVAVIGASPREQSLGFRVIRNLTTFGFAGEIIPINPNQTEVAGLRCFPTIAAADKPVDLAVLAVPAANCISIFPELAARGVKALIIPAGGFLDAGTAEGERLQSALVQSARECGLLVCGPNNMGLINVNERAAIWTASKLPQIRPGQLAILSQSGSVAIALSQDERRLGLAYVISTGNEAVLTVSDYLFSLAADPNVKVAAVFLETLRDPEAFSRAVNKMRSAGKHVVVLKVGRSAAARAAVQAHTGALAGEGELYDAFFRKHGVICARDFEELLEISALCLPTQSGPDDGAPFFITLSGGEAALVSDIAGQVGLELAQLAPGFLEKLRPVLSPLAKPGNPLDVWGTGWDDERFRRILELSVQESGFAAIVICVDAPASGSGDTAIALRMAEIAATLTERKPIIFLNNLVGAVNETLSKALANVGIAYLAGVRPSLFAVTGFLRAAAQPGGEESRSFDHSTVAPQSAILQETPQLFDVLRSAGLPMSACIEVRSAEQCVRTAERIGYPVVLKGTAQSVPHRSELGLVALGLSSAAAVRSAFLDISTKLEKHAGQDQTRRVVMQPMSGKGLELIIGARNEPGFGTLAIVGLGGTLTELLQDSSSELAPIDRSSARSMIEATRAGPLLAGYRGREKGDLDAAADALVALSLFALKYKTVLRSVEINPLIVGPQGAIAVDALVDFFSNTNEDPYAL